MIRPTGNRIVDLSFQFSIMILEYCDMLNERKRYTIANQLSRSATSIGANIAEAQSSESLADFIHKMKIADKEARETEYWLALCKYTEGYDFDDAFLAVEQEIAKLLTSIITSAKLKLKQFKNNNTGLNKAT